MESADGAVLLLLDEHRDRLSSAYRAGSAAHPAISLPIELFSRCIVRAGPDSSSGFAARIRELHAEDYFLAAACECACPGAWERLSELYLPRVRGIALRWGASPDEADDVAQALPGALLAQPPHGRTKTGIGSYDGTGSLLAWLGTIVDRELVNRARARGPRPEDQLDPRRALRDFPPLESVVHSETGERVGAAFEGALLDLSAREFLLVAAKFRDGRTQREIAEQLAISEARVSYLMTRALDRIRTAVRRDVPDETAAHWLDRDGLATVLKEVISRLLERPPSA